MRIAIIEQNWDTELWEAKGGVKAVRNPARSGTFKAVCETDPLVALMQGASDHLGPTSDSLAEDEVRLVVFQQGADWPVQLAGILSGGATTCIVVERTHETPAELVQRVVTRMQQMEQSVAQLVWLSAGTQCDGELARASQLAHQLGSPPLLVVVPSGAKVHYLRALADGPGVRRTATSSRFRRSG